MDDNDFRRNEIAATLFAVLSGLALLTLMGWLSLGKGCSRRDSDNLDRRVVRSVPAAPSDQTAGKASADNEPHSTATAGDEGDESDVEFVSLQQKVDQRSAELEKARAQSDQKELKERMESLRLDLGNAEERGAGYEAKIKKLESELAAARKAEGEKQTQLDVARQENMRLEQLVTDARKQADELKALNVEKDSLSRKLKAAVEARTAAEAVVTALKNKGNQGDERMTILNNQITTLETRLKESEGLKSKIADLEAKLKESNAMKTRVADLEKKLDGLGREKNSLTQTVNKLKADLDEASKKMSASSESEARAKSMEAEISKLKDAASKISQDATLRISKLTSDKKELTAELEKLRSQSGEMSPESSEKLKTLEDRIRKLTEENKKLTEQLSRLKSGVDSGMDVNHEQVRKLAADNAKLTRRIAALTAESGKMNSRTDDRLKALTETNEKLNREISSLKKSNAESMAAVDRLEKVRAELENARSRINSLEAEKIGNIDPERLKAAAEIDDLKLPNLVQDPSKLDTRAIPLFAELRGMDDNPVAREKLYTSIEQRGKATPVTQVKFDSGSDEVGSKKGGELAKLLASNKDAMFLVVGYASEDGDPQSNAKLASHRASNVARKIVGDSGKGDRVEAVYFGQTNRFSDEYRAPNRIVEVWKIK